MLCNIKMSRERVSLHLYKWNMRRKIGTRVLFHRKLVFSNMGASPSIFFQIQLDWGP
ncbi:hypothetical protein Lalb_Chr21g0310221 [Lupinus albus]|uniref:Uncharacterized protein n=1 Tax=Lupinus albus TaxID=3870 RepID=A0A6A4NC49_LUPAL|nr:hypothetical protein Lalb_Chr21g0310221 [Lupinus albus]